MTSKEVSDTGLLLTQSIASDTSISVLTAVRQLGSDAANRPPDDRLKGGLMMVETFMGTSEQLAVCPLPLRRTLVLGDQIRAACGSLANYPKVPTGHFGADHVYCRSLLKACDCRLGFSLSAQASFRPIWTRQQRRREDASSLCLRSRDAHHLGPLLALVVEELLEARHRPSAEASPRAPGCGP